MKLDEKLKLMIFSSYNSLINRSVTRRLIYMIVLIIEFAQYLSFILPASTKSFKSNSAFLSDIVYYVNVRRG
ncbi:MAG: hypothetical protein P4M11_02270 [Candidatus Pacebacteria bacterium]|nr:hypothetical protein [Candidatus Paceibacterota bacterium]